VPRIGLENGNRVEYIGHDIARVWKTLDGGRSSNELLVILYRGDGLDVLERAESATRVRLGAGREGWVRGVLRTTEKPPLALAFIDVGQGDACLVTTPSGHSVLVDGGENKLAARYLAARFRDETSAGRDVHFDAIVVTHGDADHFDGLSTLVLDAVAETREGKRICVTTSRVFHNGLVKRASSASERELLGAPVDFQGVPHVVVVDDPRLVPDANRPFQRWHSALSALEARRSMTVARLDSSSTDAFAFLDDVKVTVLGPSPVRLAGDRWALPLLTATNSGSVSAGSTINGHSIVLRISYGNVNVLLTGDLHGGMQSDLIRQGAHVRADVLKVPHHGSDDFDRAFMDAVSPLVSVISAGDEDARRDYLHPRASLLAALGQARRGAEPVVFVTNLAAFDRWAGEAFYAVRDGDTWKPNIERGVFYARERTAYGIIHVRTNGKRLLVVRRGARNDRYEAYAYEVAEDGSARSSTIEAI
jgi:beta-lactamase superfamily II metal-dependent hydrolase